LTTCKKETETARNKQKIAKTKEEIPEFEIVCI